MLFLCMRFEFEIIVWIGSEFQIFFLLDNNYHSDNLVFLLVVNGCEQRGENFVLT